MHYFLVLLSFAVWAKDDRIGRGPLPGKGDRIALSALPAKGDRIALSALPGKDDRIGRGPLPGKDDRIGRGPLPAKGETRVPGEWILTRSIGVRSNTWGEIRSKIQSHYYFIRSFGPESQFALIQYNRRKNAAPFSLPEGVKAQPNFIYTVNETDPEIEKQWGLKNTGQAIGDSGMGTAGVDIDAHRAWEIFSGNRTSLIAVLDTGTDLAHPDLQKNVWKNDKEIPDNGKDDDGNGYVDDRDGWNFVSQNKEVRDDNHHGTFIAGIIGSDPENGKGIRGVLKETAIQTIKILDENGSGTTERAISGIEYAVRMGAKVINASWGGRSYDQALFDAVQWAGEKGTVFVAAAGNSGTDNDNDPAPVYPASFKLANVISVVSIDNKAVKSPTSSFGNSTTHLAAPGVQIFSTMPEASYKFGNGTSFAAPFVSAGVALLSGGIPGLSSLEIKARLLQSTVPLHYYDRMQSQSGGRLNLYNALSGIKPPRYKEPTVWKKVLWSQSTPHPYENFQNISWKIHQPGATHIRVHLSKFQTEGGYDFLTLKDNKGDLVYSYSGDWDSFLSMDALGDTLHLDFTTDYVKSAYGLDMDYYEYSTE